MRTATTSEMSKQKRYIIAFGLAISTIVYNIAAGFVSIFASYEVVSLTLFGFGVASLIVVLSELSIVHMLLRIKRQPESSQDDFERTALQVTGLCLYTLVLVLVTTSIYDIWQGHKPQTSFLGILISVISIMIMWALTSFKTRIAKELNAEAIFADTKCTQVCIYIAVILLITSGIYELTKFVYIDSIGTLVLCYFAFKEGKQCCDKANSGHWFLGHE